MQRYLICGIVYFEVLNVIFDNLNSDLSKGSIYKKFIILKKVLYNY